ncbi:MAG: class C sortase [Lachnospiraceae bacterium]
MTLRKKGKKSSLARDIRLLVGFIIGSLICMYPTISDTWNFYRDQRLVAEYEDSVENLSREEYDRMLKDARKYNRRHKVNTVVDTLGTEEDYILGHPYDTLLDPAGNQIMAYLQIPKIDQELAIYHGAGKSVLEKGCGHIEGTSLPIGGKNTHAVLSAHRGLPSAKLFTDLDQMEIGDVFYITVLGEKLAYEVDQILTVLPTELDALAIKKGKDLVTLVTCTPYAVNTHRLLVRGHRIPYTKSEPETVLGKITEKPGYTRLVRLIAMLVFFIIVLIFWFAKRVKRTKKKRVKEEGEKRDECMDKTE